MVEVGKKRIMNSMVGTLTGTTEKNITNIVGIHIEIHIYEYIGNIKYYYRGKFVFSR